MPTFDNSKQKVENKHRMKKALVLFIGFICYQIICHAQVMDEHYYFKNLSVQNGLSQNTVNAILQDKQGFMCFGTKDGLNRYDGLSFRKFKHDGRSQQSIGNSFITALYEDAEGNIWVGTDVGLYIYYPEHDSFRHFEELSVEDTKIEHTVTAIVGDDQGCVWIAVESQGLFCYDLEKEQLQNYTLKNFPFISTNVQSFVFDNSGTLWIGCYGDGLFYSKDRLKTLQPYISPVDNKETFENDVVTTLVKGAYNCLYIGSLRGGAKELNLTSNKLHDLLSVDENEEPVPAGSISVNTKEGYVVASGNNSSEVKISALTIENSVINVTVNTNLSYTFVEDNGKPKSFIAEDKLKALVTIDEIDNSVDPTQNGYTQKAAITITGLNTNGTIYIYAQPKEYNIEFISDGHKVGNTLTKVVYGQELPPFDTRSILPDDKDSFLFLGYF